MLGLLAKAEKEVAPTIVLASTEFWSRTVSETLNPDLQLASSALQKPARSLRA